MTRAEATLCLPRACLCGSPAAVQEPCAACERMAWCPACRACCACRVEAWFERRTPRPQPHAVASVRSIGRCYARTREAAVVAKDTGVLTAIDAAATPARIRSMVIARDCLPPPAPLPD